MAIKAKTSLTMQVCLFSGVSWCCKRVIKSIYVIGLSILQSASILSHPALFPVSSSYGVIIDSSLSNGTKDRQTDMGSRL